jgi:hypothetical protein
MVICIGEDRESELDAVKLLVYTLSLHMPHARVELFYPPASDAFKEWLTKFPGVRLTTQRVTQSTGWDVKPQLLLHLLDAGHSEVVWMDSDILVCGDFLKPLGPLDDHTLVATEEALYGQYRDEGFRAKAWRFEVGRALPFVLNSGVVRVTQRHVPLLRRWQQLLETDAYRAAQKAKSSQKPFHLFSDQDVLTALLCSCEFADIPIKILRRGVDIIQDFGPSGYTLSERWGNLTRGRATLLHCQRDKPWRRAEKPPRFWQWKPYLKYLRLETSPYALAAARHRDATGEPMHWLTTRTAGGKFLKALGLGHPALTGWPLSAMYTASRTIKRIRRIDDRFDPAAAYAKLGENASVTPTV